MKQEYQVEVELWDGEKPVFAQQARLQDGMFGIDGAILGCIERVRAFNKIRYIVYLSREDSLESLWEGYTTPKTAETELWSVVDKMRELIEGIENASSK